MENFMASWAFVAGIHLISRSRSIKENMYGLMKRRQLLSLAEKLSKWMAGMRKWEQFKETPMIGSSWHVRSKPTMKVRINMFNMLMIADSGDKQRNTHSSSEQEAPALDSGIFYAGLTSGVKMSFRWVRKWRLAFFLAIFIPRNRPGDKKMDNFLKRMCWKYNKSGSYRE